jgi:hypothetical protein
VRALRWTISAVVVTVVLVGAAAPAQAHTFCVKRGGCLQFVDNFDTIQQAVNAADGNDAGPGGVIGDTILVGHGDYDPFQVATGNHPLTVDGSGPDTIIRVPTDIGDSKTVVGLENDSTHTMTDLTVRLPKGQGNVGVSEGTLQRVSIVSVVPQTGANVGVSVVNFSDGTIDVPDGTGAQLSSVFRARISAHVGLNTAGSVEDTVVRVSGNGGVGLRDHGTVRHVDFIGDGSSGTVGVAVNADGLIGADSVDVRNSIIRGFATNFSRTGNFCYPGCGDDPANLTVAYSDFDPAVQSDSSGPGSTNTAFPGQNTAADPGFVSTSDQHLRFDSQLVDIGDPNSPGGFDSATDLDGLPRKVDGTGSGTPRADIGALEYQRRAPVIDNASASATALSLHGRATFHAVASDPDAEPVTLAWDFGDGETATGSDVEHIFDSAGDRTVRLTARDPAGATATRDFPISVTDQPLVITATASTLTPPVGQPVTFSATSSDPDGDPATIAWDFGDANQASGSAVTHTYGTPGAVTVTVTASEANGTTAVQTLGLTVAPVAAGDGVPGDGPANPTCRVPKLKGLSLKRAKRAITRAKCKLGKVTKPRARHGKRHPKLVVKSQTPRAGKLVAAGTKVKLTLRRKPTPKRGR